MIVSVILELVATAAAVQYYFRFQIGWRHCLLKVKNYLQIHIYLNTRLRYNYFRFGKLTSDMLEFYDHITVVGKLFCISLPNCQSKSGHPRLSNDVLSIFKMAAAAAKYYFRFRKFGLGDVALLRRPKCISKLNFVGLSQATAEIWLLPVSKN